MTKLAILLLIAVAVSAQGLRGKATTFAPTPKPLLEIKNAGEEEMIKLGGLIKTVVKVVDAVTSEEEEEMIKLDKLVQDGKKINQDAKKIFDTITTHKLDEEEMLNLVKLVSDAKQIVQDGKVIIDTVKGKTLDEEEMLNVNKMIDGAQKVIHGSNEILRTLSNKVEEEQEMVNVGKVAEGAKQVVEGAGQLIQGGVNVVQGAAKVISGVKKLEEEEEMIKLGGVIKTVGKVIKALDSKEEEELMNYSTKKTTAPPKVEKVLIVKNAGEEEMIKLGGLIKTVGKVIKALDSKEEEELGLVGDAIKGAKKIIHNAVTDKDDGLVKL